MLKFVLMLGRLRNEGFRTPRIGAVSNTPNGVLTILSFPFFLFFFLFDAERTEKRNLDGVEEVDGRIGGKWRFDRWMGEWRRVGVLTQFFLVNIRYEFRTWRN